MTTVSLDVAFFSALAAAFTAVFLAELGDKTQFITLTLGARFSPVQVFGGALLALSLITAMGAAAGLYVSEYLPPGALAGIGGVFFIFMGVLTFFKDDGEQDLKDSRGTAFWKAFSLVFVGELGDKTQLAVLTLSGVYREPLPIFLGAMAAQAINHGLAAFLGNKFFSRVPPRALKYFSGTIFIIFGLLILSTLVKLFPGG